MDRVVFVSPYISIVDQNAAVAREILEPAGTAYASVVLEHHSNLVSENCTDDWRRKVLAENWDAPVVFTTMVQVLESLFGSGTRSVRRLHTLANAVIVFDEIQTLPVPLVHLFNNAINLLAAHCGSTIVLCTATQPLLQDVAKGHGAACLAKDAELISNVTHTFAAMRRYVVFDESTRAWSSEDAAALVIDEASAHGSCLLVVNTKRNALDIFRTCRLKMGGEAHLIHLSTGMCPAHRTEALKKLRDWLPSASSSAPVVCVSTQLIEAGVDIDFACVVRDLAGLDSIAQAAGRCNRHGIRPGGGRMHIINLGNLPKQLEDIGKGQTASAAVLGFWRKSHPDEPFPLDDPAQMTQYFQRYFFDRRSEMLYNVEKPVDTNLISLLGANRQTVADMATEGHPVQRHLLHQSFETAASQFAIMGETRGVVVPFRHEGKKIVENLSAAFDLDAEWQLLRQAQPYTLSVFEQKLQQLVNTGAAYPVEDDAGVYCLRPEFYDDEIGLRPEAGLMEDLFA